jgi:hypothetical protein
VASLSGGHASGRAVVGALIYLWAVAGLTALGLQRREV